MRRGRARLPLVKALAEAQVTDAEKVLIRALASVRQMQPGEEHISARDGAEEEFDPARQAQFVLQNEGLHRGLATESLAESLLSDSRLNAGRECADVLEVPATESDRRMLASILLKEDEDLTAEVLEAAVRALRRIHLRRRQEDVQQELKKPGLAANKERLRELLTELGTNQPGTARSWFSRKQSGENGLKRWCRENSVKQKTARQAI